MTKREQLEERLAALPVLEYGFLRADEVEFAERVRTVCRENCEMYGKSWACPPAVGTVTECRKRCLAYDSFFLFSTVSDVQDITDMKETLGTRAHHDKVTRQVREIFRELYGDCLVLSNEACTICRECTYPDAPCRHPDQMLPSLEGHGIVVTNVAEKLGMTFQVDAHTVIWFSGIFYHEHG